MVPGSCMLDWSLLPSCGHFITAGSTQQNRFLSGKENAQDAFGI